MNQKIKQKIEEEALRRSETILPPININLDIAEEIEILANRDNLECFYRKGFEAGAEYGYNIKERVNEKFVNCLKDFVFQCNRAEGKRSLIDLSTIETAVKLIKEFSASNQENNEVEKFEYEMYFESHEDDSVQIDGWYPISTDRIKDKDKIHHYLENGILRRINPPKENNEGEKCEHDFEIIYSVTEYLELLKCKGKICSKCGKHEDLT